MNGILIIYKEKGYTSHDVVAKLRGILKQKKIGHTGTLDPEAEGVLPVCLGNATKLCGLLTEKDKGYEAVLKLGITTDTQDLTGSVIKETPVSLSEGQIREAVLSFRGEYDQTPPMYSALKVNGKKLYELARAGVEVEREKRRVKIYEIAILDIDLPSGEVRMRIECSKGTYIRTLCQDIGDKLFVGGAMKSLLRTKAGPFLLEDSITLSIAEQSARDGRIASHILPVDNVFADYASFYVNGGADRLLYNGNTLSLTEGVLEGTPGKKGSRIRVYDSSRCFKGLYETSDNGQYLKPFKMFL